MPILAVDQGIELRGAQFPQIATVRKGSPKANGQMGKNLSYFRIVFNKGEDAACTVFNKTFGTQPTQFEAMAPFNEIARFWDYWREGYIRAGGSAGGMMIHRCDGAWVNFERDPKTRQINVMNWLDLNGQRVECQCKSGAGEPLFVGKNKKGEPVPYFCRPVGRLSLIVPALKREAYVLLTTTSLYDILNITNNLKAILDNNGHILGIPLIVSRREVEVNTPYGRRMESLIFVEASPRYVEARIAQMEYDATPRVPQLTIGRDLMPSPQTADGEGEEGDVEDGEVIDSETGEIIEAEPDRPAAQSTSAQDQPGQPPTNGNSRPYQPERLCERLAEMAATKGARTASSNQRGLAAGTLTMCFAGHDDAEARRHSVQKYLWKVESFDDLTDAQVLAALDWLSPKRDSGGAYAPDEMAIKEAKMALHAYLLDAGQQELPLDVPAE